MFRTCEVVTLSQSIGASTGLYNFCRRDESVSKEVLVAAESIVNTGWQGGVPGYRLCAAGGASAPRRYSCGLVPEACGSCHLSGNTFYGTRCPPGFPFTPHYKGSQKQPLGSSCDGSSRCHEDCGEDKPRDRAKRQYSNVAKHIVSPHSGLNSQPQEHFLGIALPATLTAI